MDDQKELPGEENPIVVDAIHSQIQHFRESDPNCRALELPEGVLLRYNPVQSMYFYLRTAVMDGKIATRVFASDSPYDRLKTLIGEVRTPMFEVKSDRHHLERIEEMLRSWIDFVSEQPDPGTDFSSFPVGDRPQA